MQPGIENHWTWQVDANSPWPVPWIYARKDILTILGCWYPFKPKASSFIIWTQVFLLLMDGTARTFHFKSLSGWVCILLSQHLALDPVPWVPLFLAERERKHELAQGGSGVSLATNQCWVQSVPHTGVTHYGQQVHWREWAKHMTNE